MSFTIYGSGGVTVVLRSPDWGDVRAVDTNDIKRYTRAGTLRVYADTKWARMWGYKYKFSRIRKSVITSLKTLLETDAGKLLIFEDHTLIAFTGYIITPVNEIVNVRPDCSYDVSFETMRVV